MRATVDLAPVRAFVQSAGRTVVLGEDPRSATRAAFLRRAAAHGRRPGYVYIILGGERYDASLRMIRDSYYLRAVWWRFSSPCWPR